MKPIYKIAMVAACPFPYPRGTPVRIFRQAESLSQMGHDVHVITYHLGEEHTELPFTLHRINPIPTYNKYEPGPTYQKLLVVDMMLALKIREVVANNGFDIVHAHHHEGLLSALLVRPAIKIPIVFDAHVILDTEIYHYTSMLMPNWLKGLIARQFDNRLPRMADAVISVSDEIKTHLAAHGKIDEDKIFIVRNGVELEHFEVPKPPSGAKKIIGFAGNFAEYQGIELLLEAFQKVREKRQDVRLHLISLASFDLYKPMAKELGIEDAIDLIPATFDELPEALARADILLNPRPQGAGYPLKLLNYMAANRPIVSFAGSARDIKHGELGWVAPNNDTENFAEGILTLLDDQELANRLANNGRKLVEAEFSWPSRGEMITEIYNQVLSQ